MARKINYNSRNFADIRGDLISYIKQYYPSILSDFNDASVGMMLLELNAAVGDLLSFHTDRMLQETQIDYAQEKKSVMAMARTFGLKIPGKRPSVSIVDWSVNIPMGNDGKYDLNYAPFISKGAQVTGGGKVFETQDDIDFSSPFTTGGIPNITIIPNYDNNGTFMFYTVTKREIVINGVTKTFKRVLTQNDVKPFTEILLPDNDVLSIESVITLESTDYTNNPTQTAWNNINNLWYEVPSLAEDKIFVIDKTKGGNSSGIRPGKYVKIDRRFITEKTDNGFTKLIFGGGNQNIDSITNFGVNTSLTNKIGDIINNQSLGITLPPNQTLFVQYRTGGGSTSNIGVNSLTSLGTFNMSFNGNATTQSKIIAIQKSLTVNNPIPCIGGRDEPSIDEIRNLVKYNFSSQNRAVTIKDYQALISLMPGQFGVPFRTCVYEYQNKILVSILTLNADSTLNNSSSNILTDNIAEYLSDYRITNDYVEVMNGQVINLGFELDLFIDKNYQQSQVISSGINAISSYMDISTHSMGENIYLGQLIQNIHNVPGVLNVIALRVFNKVGGIYSVNEISQAYINTETREIDIINNNNTLFGDPVAMFEIKKPNSDILIRVMS
jgi:hypothetical protein